MKCVETSKESLCNDRDILDVNFKLVSALEVENGEKPSDVSRLLSLLQCNDTRAERVK